MKNLDLNFFMEIEGIRFPQMLSDFLPEELILLLEEPIKPSWYGTIENNTMKLEILRKYTNGAKQNAFEAMWETSQTFAGRMMSDF